MIVYFFGTKKGGLDFIERLKDISYFRQVVNMQAKMKYRKLLMNEGIDGWRKFLNMVRTEKFVTPCDYAYEGENEEYMYYLCKYKIHRVRKDSPKAFIIRGFGTDIK